MKLKKPYLSTGLGLIIILLAIGGYFIFKKYSLIKVRDYPITFKTISAEEKKIKIENFKKLNEASCLGLTSDDYLDDFGSASAISCAKNTALNKVKNVDGQTTKALEFLQTNKEFYDFDNLTKDDLDFLILGSNIIVVTSRKENSAGYIEIHFAVNNANIFSDIIRVENHSFVNPKRLVNFNQNNISAEAAKNKLLGQSVNFEYCGYTAGCNFKDQEITTDLLAQWKKIAEPEIDWIVRDLVDENGQKQRTAKKVWIFYRGPFSRDNKTIVGVDALTGEPILDRILATIG